MPYKKSAISALSSTKDRSVALQSARLYKSVQSVLSVCPFKKCHFSVWIMPLFNPNYGSILF